MYASASQDSHIVLTPDMYGVPVRAHGVFGAWRGLSWPFRAAFFPHSCFEDVRTLLTTFLSCAVDLLRSAYAVMYSASCHLLRMTVDAASLPNTAIFLFLGVGVMVEEEASFAKSGMM
jgi:hypothetical protein